MSKREDTCDGIVILRSHEDGELLSHACLQVTKPGEWLWRQALSDTGHHLEIVKLPQQKIRTSNLDGDLLALRAANFPLDAIFVQAAEELLQRWTQVQNMEDVRFGL